VQLWEDWKDEEFEKVINKQVLVSHVLEKELEHRNDLKPATNKFKILDRLSRRQAPVESDLMPFKSPMITWDLGIFRKKKRKELKHKMLREQDINLELDGEPIQAEELA